MAAVLRGSKTDGAAPKRTPGSESLAVEGPQGSPAFAAELAPLTVSRHSVKRASRNEPSGTVPGPRFGQSKPASSLARSSPAGRESPDRNTISTGNGAVTAVVARARDSVTPSVANLCKGASSLPKPCSRSRPALYSHAVAVDADCSIDTETLASRNGAAARAAATSRTKGPDVGAKTSCPSAGGFDHELLKTPVNPASPADFTVQTSAEIRARAPLSTDSGPNCALVGTDIVGRAGTAAGLKAGVTVVDKVDPGLSGRSTVAQPARRGTGEGAVTNKDVQFDVGDTTRATPSATEDRDAGDRAEGDSDSATPVNSKSSTPADSRTSTPVNTGSCRTSLDLNAADENKTAADLEAEGMLGDKRSEVGALVIANKMSDDRHKTLPKDVTRSSASSIDAETSAPAGKAPAGKTRVGRSATGDVRSALRVPVPSPVTTPASSEPSAGCGHSSSCVVITTSAIVHNSDANILDAAGCDRKLARNENNNNNNNNTTNNNTTTNNNNNTPLKGGGPRDMTTFGAAAVFHTLSDIKPKETGMAFREIEAVEACQWLRAAGFPQYAQMFEDGLFPVDVSDVQRDHDFLDGDSIESVVRRLNILNTCAVMKIDASPCKKATEESEATEESDEEDLCALSDRWEYQKTVRRWSRKGPDLAAEVAPESGRLQSSGSHDSVLGDSGSQTDHSPVPETRMPRGHGPAAVLVTPPREPRDVLLTGGVVGPPERRGGQEVIPLQPPSRQDGPPVSSFPISPKLRRAASERLKSALKRMESFKSKKPKKPPARDIREIGDPVVADQEGMQAKLERLNCVDIAPASRQPTQTRESTPTSDEASLASHGSDVGTAGPSAGTASPPAVSPVAPAPSVSADAGSPASSPDCSSLSEYYSAHSQLLASFQACAGGGGGGGQGRLSGGVGRKGSGSSLVEIFLLPQDHKPGSFPRMLKNGYIDTAPSPFQPSALAHSQPLQSPRTPHGYRPGLAGKLAAVSSGSARASVYDNFPSSAGSPTRSLPGLGAGSKADTSDSSGQVTVTAGQPFVVGSPSASSGGLSGPNFPDSSETVSVQGTARSRSTSAAPSLDLQAPAEADAKDSASTRNGVVGSVDVADAGLKLVLSRVRTSSSTVTSDTMEEFDVILQNLYRDINNLNRALGNKDEGHEHPEEFSSHADLNTSSTSPSLDSDTSLVSQQMDLDYSMSQHVDLGVLVAPQHSSREHSFDVSFSVADQNGDVTINSISGSLMLETQLSQTSVSETDRLRSPASPNGGDDSAGEENDLGSQTTSSQESSDEVEGSADDTLERLALGARDRRDSGVGSSLTRGSERRRKKIRWESFQKSHRPTRGNRELQIDGLSVCQLLPLRQLSLLKLTSIMEKASPASRSQWSWSVPRFMKRHRAPHYCDKNVFGVPFTVVVQRTGQPLPQCVLYAMRYLRRTAHDSVGIFRKSGVRSRIQKLRDLVEANPDTIRFEELQSFDVADLLKQYFRELPECLLTNKLTDTFRSIFTHVPPAQRLEALQTTIILLPEENREVLQSLLFFLYDIAQLSSFHQMNASNLAVCFAPSLFNTMPNPNIANSPRRQRKSPGMLEHRELLEQKGVLECFTYMISECKKLFMVPPSMYSRLHLSTLSNMEPVHLEEFYAQNKELGPDYRKLGPDYRKLGPDYRAFGEENIQVLLKEAHEKNRGWAAATTVCLSGVEVLQRKPLDGHPLRQWKCSVEIEAPPIEVLNRILHERHKWDDDMLSWEVVHKLDKQHADVFHYVLNCMAPHPPRHFMVIRYWRADLVKGACALVSKSVEYSGAHLGAVEYDQGVRGVELGTGYLMEPCGSGRSRLTYIARTDLRGRCPEWYNRVFGHMCANFLDRLRDSFRQEAEGPETKV